MKHYKRSDIQLWYLNNGFPHAAMHLDNILKDWDNTPKYLGTAIQACIKDHTIGYDIEYRRHGQNWLKPIYEGYHAD